jgi:hypothetical protein
MRTPSDLAAVSPSGTVFAALAALAFLSACQATSDSYYPLEERLRWEMEMSGEEAPIPGEPLRKIKNEQISLLNLPRRQLGGVEVVPQMGDFRGHQWFAFVAADERGIYEVANQAVEQSEPELVDGRFYILKFPVAAGTTWERSVQTSSLKEEQVELIGTSTIVSVGESVTVPAGTFSNCAQVRTTAADTTRVPQVFGPVKVEVEMTEWLAPGVGVVKAERVEKTDRPELGGGTMQVALKRFASL